MRSREQQGRNRSSIATLVFFALTAPFGIVAHLLSELAGLGWHDDADVLLSPRHGYLAIAAIVALSCLAFAVRAIPRSDRKARVAALIDALPFHGRGMRFALVSFVAQFGFFALTQIGEGCPLCSGDVVVGAFAAAIAATLGALLVTLGKRRILEFAFALVHALCVLLERPSVLPSRERLRVAVALSARRRTPFSFRYRPPPSSFGLRLA